MRRSLIYMSKCFELHRKMLCERRTSYILRVTSGNLNFSKAKTDKPKPCINLNTHLLFTMSIEPMTMVIVWCMNVDVECIIMSDCVDCVWIYLFATEFQFHIHMHRRHYSLLVCNTNSLHCTARRTYWYWSIYVWVGGRTSITVCRHRLKSPKRKSDFCACRHAVEFELKIIDLYANCVRTTKLILKSDERTIDRLNLFRFFFFFW